MLRSLEKIFVVLMLLYTTGAILPFFAGRGSATQASTFELAVQVPLYCLTFFFIMLHWRSFLDAAVTMKWILALTALAVASSVWSQVPAFTLRRSTILVATTAFGIYFGTRFDVNGQLRLLSRVFAIAICASLFAAIFFPRYGIDATLHHGDWQGVFAQKNGLGRAMALSAVVFFFARPRAGRWMSWLGVISSLILLYLSKSVTAALVMLLVIGMLLVFRLFRTRFTFALPIFTLGTLVLSLVLLTGVLASPEFLRFINRDPGLTGRTSLWNAVGSAIAQRPWFGWGFESFWLGMQGASGTLVQQLHWAPPNSHNGFLDLVLEVGIIGLCLFVVGYVFLCGRALVFLKRYPGHIPVWLCTYLFFMLAYNSSERTILEQNSIFWVLYISTAASLYLHVPYTVMVPEPAEPYGLHAAEPAPEAV